jgi:hypothetical protein
VGEYYDQAVRGADALDARRGFAAMLEHIASNGARTIIVETANRFAGDLIVQETGHNFAMTAQCFHGDFYFTASTTKAS